MQRPAHRVSALAFASAGTVVVFAALTFLNEKGLRTESAPLGIVSFEFCGDLANCRRITDEWGQTAGRVLAGFHLGLDYLFLVLYPFSISLACAILADSKSAARHSTVASKLGNALSRIVPFAGVLDAVENGSLLALLLLPPDEESKQQKQQPQRETFLPRIAWWCAAIKFGIVGAGLAYAVLMALAAVMSRFPLLFGGGRTRGAAGPRLAARNDEAKKLPHHSD